MSRESDIVLRGDDAARAQRIDLVAAPVAATGMARPSLSPTGPWAANVDSAFAAARDEGFAVGHQEGWEVGLTRGLAEGREQMAQVEAAVSELYQGVEQELDGATTRLAQEATGLALAIARAVLNRELACAVDPGADAIVRCLRMIPLTGPVVARLHPDDAEALGHVADLDRRDLTIVPDPDLTRGDAVVTVDESLVDGRIDAALNRIVELLA